MITAEEEELARLQQARRRRASQSPDSVPGTIAIASRQLHRSGATSDDYLQIDASCSASAGELGRRGAILRAQQVGGKTKSQSVSERANGADD
jgi:hypothetical protein